MQELSLPAHISKLTEGISVQSFTLLFPISSSLFMLRNTLGVIDLTSSPLSQIILAKLVCLIWSSCWGLNVEGFSYQNLKNKLRSSEHTCCHREYFYICTIIFFLNRINDNNLSPSRRCLNCSDNKHVMVGPTLESSNGSSSKPPTQGSIFAGCP